MSNGLNVAHLQIYLSMHYIYWNIIHVAIAIAYIVTSCDDLESGLSGLVHSITMGLC